MSGQRSRAGGGSERNSAACVVPVHTPPSPGDGAPEIEVLEEAVTEAETPDPSQGVFCQRGLDKVESGRTPVHEALLERSGGFEAGTPEGVCMGIETADIRAPLAMAQIKTGDNFL